jgi:tetratricopeptide (TPR) repeat protein
MALSEMLASRYVEGMDTARRTLELADLLGLPAIKAAALDFTGVCRAGLGDPGGIDDIKQAVAIAADANAPYEVARAYNNLASVYGTRGEVAAAREATAKCIRVSEEYGQHVWRRWQRPSEAMFAYSDGDWERCLAIADDFLADRSSDYTSAGVLDLRGLIRLARGDADGALADAERGVELARTARDPQALYAPLLDASYIAVSAARRDRAAELLEEALAFAEGPVFVGVSAESLLRAGWTATLLDASDAFLAAVAGESDSAWIRGARAVAEGDLSLAADLCRELRCGPDEAYARLRLAVRLAAEGRRAEADIELHAALAFFHKAGATRYIREGEALLATAS